MKAIFIMVLPLIRPFILGEVKKYLTKKVPPVYATVAENNIDLLEAVMKAYADGTLTKKEQAKLKAVSKRMAKNLPDLIDQLPTVE